MSGRPPDTESDPDSGEHPEPSWDEADVAMHRLLEAAFDPAGAGSGERPTPYLASFPPHPVPLSGRELSVGETLGRFRIEKELGWGGFGVVYRATDTHLGRVVALKVPRPDRLPTVALWDQFAREARLAASLDHEAIVPVLEAGVLEGVFAIVSAYQEGEPLSRWLATRHPEGMPPRLAADIALRLADGLRHAHEHGVLHRDLKPANVLMVEAPGRPGEWNPRITDFGLGTFHDEAASATLTGFWQGSPPYMAPEQVLPDLGRVDARSDVYALGAILYEMLTGRAIYPGPSMVELSLLLGRGEPPVRPRRLRPKLPVDLETICLTCLERTPDKRYRSAAGLRDDLGRFLERRPIRARPVSPWGRLGRWARRRPSLAALVALAVAATGLTAGLIARHEWQLETKNAELVLIVDKLEKSSAERDSANAELSSTLERLRASERSWRRTAFAADLNLVNRELASGRVEMAQTLLRRHEHAPDGEDLRGFTHRYLMRQATRVYSVHTLDDFRWWRGAVPIARTFEALDRANREKVRVTLPSIIFDPAGIRQRFSGNGYRLGDRYLGLHVLHDPPCLQLDIGRSAIPSGLPDFDHVLGPGGSTLALSSGTNSERADESPPLKPLPDLAIPDEPGSRQPVAPRVVLVPPSYDVNFSGDGGTLACLAEVPPHDNSRVRPLIYDLGSDWRASYSGLVRPAVLPHPGIRTVKTSLVLSQDGRLAALTGLDPRVLVFEARTGRPLWSLGSEATGADALVMTLEFSPDGACLVTGTSSGQVRDWDATTGRPLGQFPVNVGFVSTVGFHPDSRTIAIIAGDEGAIRLWNRAPEPEPPAALDHGDEVWGLAFANEGRTLVSVGDDYQVQTWDVASGARISRAEAANLLTAVAVGGRSLAVADYDGLVTVYTTEPGDTSPRFVLDGLKGTRLRALAWSPDGRSLVASGKGTSLLVASWAGEAPTTRLVETPYKDNYGLAFSPDGKTLAIGSNDRSILLRTVPDFRPRATLEAQAPVTCVAYSPDGKTLVSGDVEGGLQFRDMPEGTLRSENARASDTGGIGSIAFSPDGKTLATSSDDGVVRLWDPVLAVERLALVGHEAKVHALAFSPDGRALASGDFKGKIRLWHAGPPE